MMISKKIAALSLSCLAVPSATGAGYLNSRESFHKYLKDICLPEEIEAIEGTDWKIAQDKLTGDSTNASSKEFKDLRSKLNAISDSNNAQKKSGSHLKELCTKIYGWTYKAWFFQEDTIFNDLKSFCSLKVLDKLDKGKKFNVDNDTDKTAITEKLNNLKSHADEEQNGNLDEALLNLKASNNTEKDWETLRNWCRDTYKEAYLGTKTSNKLKLAHKYCQKN